MKKISIAFSLLVSVLPLLVLAHPGHGETEGFSITHYFIEPVHFIISLTILVAAVVYIRHLSKKPQAK